MNIPDAELAQLDSLEGTWASFQHTLDETYIQLERTKETFRERLVRMVDGFVKDMGVSREAFLQDAPFSHEVGPW